jgi:5'-3' exonuclease
MTKVLIDGTFLLVRSCFSPNVQSDSDPTRMFLRHLWEFRDLGDLIVVFDGKRPDFRTDFFPDYKKKGGKEPDDKMKAKLEEVARLKDLNRASIKGVLSRTGMPVVQHPEWEADDQVARLSEYFLGLGEKVVAVTSDSDYFQLCAKGVDVYRPFHNETVDAPAFSRKFGFHVDFYVIYLALCGTHNSVPGIPGVGPVSAAKVVRSLSEPTLDGVRQWAKINKGALADKVRGGFGVLKRNLLLVDLDRIPLTAAEMGELWLQASSRSSFEFRPFMTECQRLGIKGTHWAPFLSSRKTA